MSNFSDLGLVEPLMRALDHAGYDIATPIQQQAIPPLLVGFDLMGCAQTGTGKTAAFALPTLQRLTQSAPATSDVRKDDSARPNRLGPRAIRGLVLAPTRELAAQIQQSFANYGRYLNLRFTVIHGGVNQTPQVKTLQRGVDVVIATPGRLLDLMNQGFVNLSKVEVLILDEADQMFDMGFLPDLKRIIAKVPVDRQTLMFSATMPDEIRQQAKQWLYEPKYVEVAKVSSASVQISQSVFHVTAPNKSKLLVSYLKTNPVSRCLVFTRTKHGADQLVKVLQHSNINAVAIHGNKSQNARTRHLEQFKSNRPPILVATDIAARGIDVSGVSHVINYQLPEVPECYVHRIGRTGRADATGIAVSFCSPEERGNLRDIERLVGNAVEVADTFPELTYAANQYSSDDRSDRSRSPRREGSSRGNKRVRSRSTSNSVVRRTAKPATRPQATSQTSSSGTSRSGTTAAGRRPRSNRNPNARRRSSGDLIHS